MDGVEHAIRIVARETPRVISYELQDVLKKKAGFDPDEKANLIRWVC